MRSRSVCTETALYCSCWIGYELRLLGEIDVADLCDLCEVYAREKHVAVDVVQARDFVVYFGQPLGPRLSYRREFLHALFDRVKPLHVRRLRRDPHDNDLKLLCGCGLVVHFSLLLYEVYDVVHTHCTSSMKFNSFEDARSICRMFSFVNAKPVPPPKKPTTFVIVIDACMASIKRCRDLPDFFSHSPKAVDDIRSSLSSLPICTTMPLSLDGSVGRISLTAPGEFGAGGRPAAM